MIGPDCSGTFTARSFANVSALARATSTPSNPSRSTTVAAPPPVVAMTPTREWPMLGGLRPTTSGGISRSASR